MKICARCNKEFKAYQLIEGKKHNLSKRVYCLECSPFKKHNTRKLKFIPIGLYTATTKQCCGCKEVLYVGNFYKKTGTILQAYCKRCLLDKQMLRWQDRKRKAIVYKGSICEDCKQTYPAPIYQFHHLDPNTKDYDWNKLRQLTWTSVLKELDKCILLCANCHILRHSNYK